MKNCAAQLLFLATFFAVAKLPAQRFSRLKINDLASQQPAPKTSANCSAGTLKIGKFIGQSNDILLDTIFLCAGDSLLIDHDGNGVFSDPQPLTAPGIGYLLYGCAPTVSGSDTASVNADPCIFRYGTPPNPFPFVAVGLPNGDIWFRNAGILQIAFNLGRPIRMWFAPSTLDDFDNLSWEVANGMGCTAVNPDAAFDIVYLNRIEGTQILKTGCLGRAKLQGGLPGYDASKKYGIEIKSSAAPSVEGFVMTPPAGLKHGGALYFSVPQPGKYEVEITDDKNCHSKIQMDFTGCDPTKNLQLAAPEHLEIKPGMQVCVPIPAKNFKNLLAMSFNLGWDGEVLKFLKIENLHPQLFSFAQNGAIISGLGDLSFAYFAPGAPFDIPDGEPLFDLCLEAVGDSNQCSSVFFKSEPGVTNFADSNGNELAFFPKNGEICLKNQPLGSSGAGADFQKITVAPNPADEFFSVRSPRFSLKKISLADPTGHVLQVLDFFENENFASFEVGQFPNGFYFLKIETSAGAVVRKVVVW